MLTECEIYEIMKLEMKDVAKSLDLPVGTIERWIRQGRIPIKCRGDLCVFDKLAMKRWAKHHNLSFFLAEKNNGAPGLSASDALENLSSSIRRGGVVKNINGETTETVFKEVVNTLDGLEENEKEELFERLLQREELVSTGIGKGVAIPHPRAPMPEIFKSPIILTCFLENSIDYGAIDDQPVFIMFFLLSPNTECHLHLLSRLSFCLRDSEFNKFLRGYPEQGILIQKIEALEEQIDRADKK